jgi:hypothetical protein
VRARVRGAWCVVSGACDKSEVSLRVAEDDAGLEEGVGLGLARFLVLRFQEDAGGHVNVDLCATTFGDVRQLVHAIARGRIELGWEIEGRRDVRR